MWRTEQGDGEQVKDDWYALLLATVIYGLALGRVSLLLLVAGQARLPKL